VIAISIAFDAAQSHAASVSLTSLTDV